MEECLRSLDLEMGPVYTEKAVVATVEAQRAVNCALGLPSVARPKAALRPDARVAIVGYGPSLADTWEDIERGEFDAVWTVSKAHDYLRVRGVTPTHHTDTDYRPHKAKFNTRFGRLTKYMIATQVHPSYLEPLAGQDVSLFHVEQEDGGFFDPRYLRQPATLDAGLQAARLAYYLGYRSQEWFGMDASVRGDAAHAGPHEGIAPEFIDVIVAGERRRSSTILIRQAFFAEKLLCKLPHLRVTIHGDGMLRPLLQERGKCLVS